MLVTTIVLAIAEQLLFSFYAEDMGIDCCCLATPTADFFLLANGQADRSAFLVNGESQKAFSSKETLWDVGRGTQANKMLKAIYWR
ncbi:hypothetical protein Tco_0657274 [Tanacetum coccineum]|uniref:Uncharacterized protein n=1 Tax=Tanacetum coccineum TaxID=301880 RepID=A0ABQ4XB53_9ASTR